MGNDVAVSGSSVRREALRDPDVRLMLEVRGDSAPAFEELMLRFQGRLVTVLEHLVGNRDQAEDLGQEGFLRVYRSRKTTSRGELLHLVVHDCQQRGEQRLAEPVPPPRGEPRRPGKRPSGRPPAGKDRPGLQRPDARPPARQGRGPRHGAGGGRHASTTANGWPCCLSKFEEMSYADIAQSMQMSPQAIKSLLSRARVNLREVLQPYLERGDRPATGQTGQRQLTRHLEMRRLSANFRYPAPEPAWPPARLTRWK